MSGQQVRIRHTIRRSDWTCAVCGVAYPCAERRDRYLTKLNKKNNRDLPRVLRQMARDAQAAIGLTDEEAYERFIAWTVATPPGGTTDDPTTESDHDAQVGSTHMAL